MRMRSSFSSSVSESASATDGELSSSDGAPGGVKSPADGGSPGGVRSPADGGAPGGAIFPAEGAAGGAISPADGGAISPEDGASGRVKISGAGASVGSNNSGEAGTALSNPGIISSSGTPGAVGISIVPNPGKPANAEDTGAAGACSAIGVAGATCASAGAIVTWVVAATPPPSPDPMNRLAMPPVTRGESSRINRARKSTKVRETSPFSTFISSSRTSILWSPSAIEYSL